MIIVTLSVVCTLKGACQHTLFNLGGVEIHEYESSKQCQRCRRYSTDFKALNAMYVGDIGDGVFKALNAMYVGDVRDGVCSFDVNAYRHTVYCIHAPHPSKREGSF